MTEEELKTSLEECEKQKNEYLSGWQRARADLLNYQKEESERFKEMLKFAGMEFILKVIEFLDSFLVAEKSIPETEINNPHLQGLLRIKIQMEDFLKSEGVEPIKALGEKFNPQFHEAVEEVESEKEQETIIEEVARGYLFQGLVLRPTKVKISKLTK